MRQSQGLAFQSVLRATSIAVVASAIVLGSGCSWFKTRGNGYAQNPRPLEVPPDLVAAPANSGQSNVASAAASAASLQGFQVQGSRDVVFAKVDKALRSLQGVTVTNSAQAIGIIEITNNGTPALVRVTENNGQSTVTAVDPQGQSGNAAALQQLLTALRAAL